MITGRPQVDERSSSMRPVARQRMKPTSSQPDEHPRPSTRHERTQQSRQPTRGNRSKKGVSAFFVVLAGCCWLIWHWSQNAIMVLLEENGNILNQNIATGAPRKHNQNAVSSVVSVNPASSPRDEAKDLLNQKIATGAPRKNKQNAVSSVVSVNPASSPRDKAKKASRNKAKKASKDKAKMPSIDPSEKAFFIRGPIFYNVYVPDTKIENVKIIVSEQLEEYKAMDPNSTIVYTLIANKHADTIEGLINSTCPTCQQRTKVSHGDEVDTLQAVWEYCSSDAVPSTITNDTLVSYIHNKGSFHPSKMNGRARRRGTRCTLSCRQQMPSNPNLCNMCTSVFRVVPQYHGSTNMWTSTCSYIKGLKSPRTYGQLLQSMYDNTLNHTTKQYEPQYRCLRPTGEIPNQLGLGRYATERWAFSHPAIKPCDVLRMNGIAPGDFDSGNWTPSRMQRAPRTPPKGMGLNFFRSSFARLEGRLFEWKYLYGKAPANTSWVWKWYHGEYERGTKASLEKCQNVSMPQ